MFHGENKSKYDKDNVFQFQQSISLAKKRWASCDRTHGCINQRTADELPIKTDR